MELMPVLFGSEVEPPEFVPFWPLTPVVPLFWLLVEFIMSFELVPVPFEFILPLVPVVLGLVVEPFWLPAVPEVLVPVWPEVVVPDWPVLEPLEPDWLPVEPAEPVCKLANATGTASAEASN